MKKNKIGFLHIKRSEKNAGFFRCRGVFFIRPKKSVVRQRGWDAGKKSTLGGYVSEHAGLFFCGKFP
jgi:hypothetical protein